MTQWYILGENKTITEATDEEVSEMHYPQKGSRFYDPDTLHGRLVYRTDLNPEWDIYVSTVFLCLNHAFSGEQQPVLFETMAWVGGEEVAQFRYETYDQALSGHFDVLESLLRKHVWND